MRQVYQLDAVDGHDGWLEVGETSKEGVVGVAIIRPSGDLARLCLDKKSFKELANLYYQIDWKVKGVLSDDEL